MIRRRKVLFFLNNFQIGGAHLQMTYLIRALREESFEPIICTHLNEEGGLQDLYYGLDVKIYNLSRKNIFDLTILKKLRAILIKEEVELIVLFMPHNFVYYRLVKRFIGRKIYQVGLLRAMGFWLGHKNHLFNIVDEFLCSRFIKTSDIVIANSNAIKEKYDNLLKLPEDKIKVVYNSSEFNFKFTKSRDEVRQELGISQRHIVVIMVARLDPWKDFDTFLNAAKEVNQRSEVFKFIICGGGILQHSLKELIKSNSLEMSVYMLGEKRNVHDYINASDISVLTTKGEGFSNVIMESMALAKPVIATNVGGNSELLGTDSECGFLIEPYDYSSLSKHLLTLANNKELMVKVGVKAKERIYSLCNKKRNMDIIIDQFKSLREDKS